MHPRSALALITGVLLLATGIPAADAHPAAPPIEIFTRILHDCNDDWAGHQVSSQHGHDLIALDIQEFWDGSTGQDMAKFRFVMNGGFGGPDPPPVHRAVTTFKAAGADQILEIRTTDNMVWTGTFASVTGPSPWPNAIEPDGARFYVDGIIALADLGATPSENLASFFVQGYAGQTKADHMVGGSTLSGNEQPCPLGPADDARFERPAYPLQGPSYYADVSVDKQKATVKVGENLTLTLTVSNLLFDHAQQIAVTGSGLAATDLTFHTTDYFRGGVNQTMEAETEGIVHLYVEPQTGSQSGVLQLDLTTDLGGHVQRTVDITIVQPAPVNAADPDPTTTPTDGGDAQDVPGTRSVWLLSAIASAAFIIRRRM